MHIKHWIELLVISISFAAVWYGATLLMPFWGSEETDVEEVSSFQVISVEDEVALGDFIVEQLAYEEVAVRDSFVAETMLTIEQRLLSAIQTTRYAYKFLVVPNASVNAMTFPGGRIVVFTGLIDMAQSPEELAAVLAHEIGHAEKQHVVDKMLTELGLTVVLSVVTGGDAGVVNELVIMLLSSVFSRAQESEADQFGLDLLERASIDPKALGRFFERLNEADMSYAAEFEWFMSHPHNDARIEASDAHALPADFEVVPIDIDWEAFKAAL